MLNKKTIESLIKSGAFDDIGPNRASLFAYIDTAVERAAQAADAKAGVNTAFVSAGAWMIGTTLAGTFILQNASAGGLVRSTGAGRSRPSFGHRNNSGAGHVPYFTHPEECARLLSPWLASLVPATGVETAA